MHFAAFSSLPGVLSGILVIAMMVPDLQGQDTVALQDVSIVARKSDFSSIGKKTEKIDSAIKQQFRFSSVAELLSPNTAVFMKTYGSGGISTTALRGGSAEQTAVLWNGMNLQNTMLGQTDLGLVPAFLFESVGVEYGGSSALWGSGAMGGSIHLENRARFGRRFNITGGLGAGSVGQLNGSAVIDAGTERFVNTTRLYTTHSANQFTYRHPAHEGVVTMTNAAFQSSGLMNELRFAPGNKHVLSLNTWMSGSERRVPGYDPQHAGKLFQDDRALRLLGGWNYTGNRWRGQVRGAWFSENLEFNDSVARQYTKNRLSTVMFDNENFLRWGRSHEFYAGLSYLYAAGNSDSYNAANFLQRLSVLAGNRFSFARNKLKAAINGRAEYFSAGVLPVTANIAVEYRPWRQISAGLNLATLYRQPTLNELYWRPGGNPALKPEQGKTINGVLSFMKPLKKYELKISVSGFSRLVTNWILWVPGTGGHPGPLNVQEVWSRGLETSWKIRWQNAGSSAGAFFTSSYLISTVNEARGSSNASVGKQMVYTPRYMFNGNVHAGFRSTSVYLFAHYAGYRFTSSDNSTWLGPYTLLSLRATQRFDAAHHHFIVFAACNNLLNADYVVLAGRPMPLRYFELGINMHFKIKKSETP